MHVSPYHSTNMYTFAGYIPCYQSSTRLRPCSFLGFFFLDQKRQPSWTMYFPARLHASLKEPNVLGVLCTLSKISNDSNRYLLLALLPQFETQPPLDLFFTSASSFLINRSENPRWAMYVPKAEANNNDVFSSRFLLRPKRQPHLGYVLSRISKPIKY